MLSIHKLGENVVELNKDDRTILFSYNTPVAYAQHGKFFRTDKRFSTTTTKHINQWLKDNYATAQIVPHKQIEDLL